MFQRNFNFDWHDREEWNLDTLKKKPRPQTSASFTLRVSSSLRQLSEQPLCSHWISETESMTVTGGARACMPTDSKSGLSVSYEVKG